MVRAVFFYVRSSEFKNQNFHALFPPPPFTAGLPFPTPPPFTTLCLCLSSPAGGRGGRHRLSAERAAAFVERTGSIDAAPARGVQVTANKLLVSAHVADRK
jgi:hypothetical protein